MVLTITREEVENLVRQKYALPEDIKILIKETDSHSIPPLKVTVNNENFVEHIECTEEQCKRDDAVHNFPEPVKSKKPLRQMTMEEKTDTYERYAQVVEDFIHSDKDVQYIDLEGMSPSAMRYRYNTAITMHGFKDDCYASANDHGGDGYAKLVRRGAKCITT